MAANETADYSDRLNRSGKPRRKSGHTGAKVLFFLVFSAAVLYTGVYMGRHDITPLVHIRSEYMIGVFQGSSPLQTGPLNNINPAVTAEMVTDVKADFVADPFMIKEGNKWYMFFEILESTKHKGIIGVAESEDGYSWTYGRVVLEEPFHLSYPTVFRHNGEILMIPESHEDYCVSVYKTENFPYEWKKYRTILEGDYVDPTLINYEDYWYMFVSDRNDMLHLFFASDVYGEWRKHPASPIVRLDAENARPGGRVIQYNGGLIRFAQNCKPSYGWDVRAFIISELTPQTYKEEAYAANPILKGSSVITDWNGIRMHHIDPHQTDDSVWIASVDGVGRWNEFSLGIFSPKMSKSVGPVLTPESPYKKKRGAKRAGKADK